MTEKRVTTNWKEERRKRAWALYQDGWAQKDIAEALGVTPGAVSQWVKRGLKAGAEGLLQPNVPERPSKLKVSEHQRLKELLAQGAESLDFEVRFGLVSEWAR